MNTFSNVYLLSYATASFKNLQIELEESARRYGISNLQSYTEEKFQKLAFFKEHYDILKMQRGAGYWLWKPYLILNTLHHLKEGDILLYADSGCRIIDNPKVLINIAKKNKYGIVVFDAHPETNKAWTKRDAFILLGCDNEAGWNSTKVIATVLLFRKSSFSISFVQEWLEACCQKAALTDDLNIHGPNLPTFKDHRHDQALLGLLVFKHQIETYRNPSPWGNFLKMKKYRVKGEHISYPYFFNNSIKEYAKQSQTNSPYHTIFEFNRRNSNHYLRQPLHGWDAFKMRLGYLKKNLLDSFDKYKKVEKE